MFLILVLIMTPIIVAGLFGLVFILMIPVTIIIGIIGVLNGSMKNV